MPDKWAMVYLLILLSFLPLYAHEACFAPQTGLDSLNSLGSISIKSFRGEPVTIPLFNDSFDPSRYFDLVTFQLKPDIGAKDLIELTKSYDELKYGADLKWELAGQGMAGQTLKLHRENSKIHENFVTVLNGTVIPASGSKTDDQLEKGTSTYFTLSVDGKQESVQVTAENDLMPLIDCLSGKESIKDTNYRVRFEQRSVKDANKRRKLGTFNVRLKDRMIKSHYSLTVEDIKTFQDTPKVIHGIPIEQYLPHQEVFRKDYPEQNCQDFATQTEVDEKSLAAQATATQPGEDFKITVSWKTTADSGKAEKFTVRRMKLPEERNEEEEESDLDWSSAQEVYGENVHKISSSGSEYGFEDSIFNDDTKEVFGDYAYGLFHQGRGPLSTSIVKIEAPPFALELGQVYPNPLRRSSQDNIFIKIDNHHPVKLKAEVLDTMGRSLGQFQIPEVAAGKGNEIPVPVDELGMRNIPPGRYIFRVIYEGKFSGEKPVRPLVKHVILE